MQSRLEKLFDFLKEDPNDPFTLYAIATEYTKSDLQKALTYYDKLLAEHENYPGTYYHAAKLYADLGKREKADEIFNKGIAICLKLNERNALRELRSAYQEFLDE